jgi:L-amino acid N-acyltransferase YncA
MGDSDGVDLQVRAMTAEDWPRVRAIYEAGIATGNATFETEAPAWEPWDGAHLEAPRLVASRGGDVLGWAALSPVSDRCVYEGVAEVSVYVDPACAGQGVGTAVLAALVQASEAAGIWTLQTGIFPENEASLALHQRCGFRVVGRRERIGRMGDRWRDVMFMERRSASI